MGRRISRTKASRHWFRFCVILALSGLSLASRLTALSSDQSGPRIRPGRHRVQPAVSLPESHLSRVMAGYVLAAIIGAVLILIIQWILRLRSARQRRAAWGSRMSFRRYTGLIVADERGTTEIDEVLVTPAGVFVIEKKDFNAWIYGEERDEYWTAVYPTEKHKFQNPIRQNFRHLKALESHLGVPRSRLSSLVAFSPRSRLMKAAPRGVLTEDHVEYIRSIDDVAISPVDFDSICLRLDALAAKSDEAALGRHVTDLHARFDSTTRCPKCSGNLVQRRSRASGDEANVFLGCSNYPSCRYVRNIDPADS
jgi:restriction system protein